MTVYSPPGEVTDLEEYLAQHPEIDDELRGILAALCDAYTGLWMQHIGFRQHCPCCDMVRERLSNLEG